jgi:hypothetical protein
VDQIEKKKIACHKLEMKYEIKNKSKVYKSIKNNN